MNEQIKSLSEIFSKKYEIDSSADEPKIKVNISLRRATFAYEKLRNIIDYQDEHLFLKNSIRRILKRRLTLGETRNIAQKLLRELVWAGYFPDETLPESYCEKVEKVIRKYNFLRRNISSKLKPKRISNILMGLMACEIEEMLSPRTKQYSFLDFASEIFINQINLENPEEAEMSQLSELVKIAVEQSILKEDREQIIYRLFQEKIPSWKNFTKSDTEKLAKNFNSLYNEFDNLFQNPFRQRIYRFIKKNSAPLLVFYNILNANPQNLALILRDESYLKEKIEGYLDNEYREVHRKVLRAISRAIIFILLTKIILAFIIEVPYEIAFRGEIDYKALTINITFPPLLMLITGLLIKVPGQKNTEKILKNIREMINHQKLLSRPLINLRPKRGLIFNIFNAVYSILSLGVIAVVIWALISLQFNAVSIVLFFIFVSIVSFLAFRIRSTASELRAEAEDEGILLGIFEVIFLPFIRIGRWLSDKFSEYNFTLFFWDFIVEAPLKAVVSALEGWFLFVREKKEEFE